MSDGTGRAVWRGHLRLALVSCPVALHTAHHAAAELRFHYINPETGNRVRMITLDAETGDELSRRDLVRGYEFRKDTYLIMNDEDFEAARIESSSVITVEKFVPADAIDPVYFDSAYYLVPDGEAGQDVYVVLREAIAGTGRMALSRVVIARRERTIAIRPMGKGMVVHTLHDAKDLYDPAALFDGIPDLHPEAEMVKLASQLIERQSGNFQPADMTDRYEARLREVIDAKLKGEGIAPEPEEAERDNVVDLMAALKRSLGQDAEAPPRKPTRGKAPARKAPTRKPAARKRA